MVAQESSEEISLGVGNGRLQEIMEWGIVDPVVRGYSGDYGTWTTVIMVTWYCVPTLPTPISFFTLSFSFLSPNSGSSK